MATVPLAANASVIDAFVDALWLEDGLARNSLAAYRRDVEALAGWLDQRRLFDASQVDLQGWLADQFSRSRASTANRRLATLRRFYRWALRDGKIAADPTLTLVNARLPARFPKSLSEKDVEHLLTAGWFASVGLAKRTPEM